MPKIRKQREDLIKAIDSGIIDEVKDLIHSTGVDFVGLGSPMSHAVIYNRLEIVKFLVEQGASVERSKLNPHESPPVNKAFQHDHQEIAQFLIEKGANLNHMEKHGYCPMYFAIIRNNRELIDQLLELDVKVDRTTANYQPFTSFVAALGDIELLKEFMARGSELKKEYHSSNELLTNAVYSGSLEMMHFLIDSMGVEPDTRDQTSDVIHPLAAAAGKKDMTMTKYLVEELKVDINAKAKVGTALNYISSQAEPSLEIMRYLLENGADPEIQGDGGYVSLSTAASAGNPEVVKLLLKYGANPNPTRTTRLPILMACNRDNLEVVKILDQAGATASNLNACLRSKNPEIAAYYQNKTNSGKGLIEAFETRNLSEVSRLIQAGADPDSRLGPHKRTLLMIAADSNDIEMIQLLIKGGANPNFTNAMGWSPLLSACHNYKRTVKTEVIKLLLESGADPNSNRQRINPLSKLCEQGNLEAVKVMLEFGAEVNPKIEPGSHPFIGACGSGNLELVKLLVSRGAETKAQGKYGENAISATLRMGNADVLNYLVNDLQIDPNYFEHQQIRMFRDLIQRGKLDMLKILVANGLDLNLEYDQKKTPLFLIGELEKYEKIYPEVFAWMIENGAEVNHQDNYGNTPLHEAVKANKPEVVELFLAKGADPKLRNNLGSLLHLCAHRNNIRLFDRFAGLGLEADERGYDDQTPLLMAYQELDRYRRSPHRSSPFSKDNGGMPLWKHIILNYDVDINHAPNERQYSILNLAVRSRKLEEVDFMLAHGADINAMSGYRFANLTTLDISVPEQVHVSSNLDYVKKLIQRGADPNLADGGGGKTPLMEACGVGDFLLVKYLVEEQKVNIHHTTRNGENALTYAAGLYHSVTRYSMEMPVPTSVEFRKEIFRYLIKKGLSMTTPCGGCYVSEHEKGSLPFHLTNDYQLEHLDYMLSKGLDPNFKLSSGRTLLMHAVERDQLEAAKLLLKRGADPKLPHRNYDLSQFANTHRMKKWVAEILEK